MLLTYHGGENTNALVLANMVSPMKVRHAGLRRRRVKAKWLYDAFKYSPESSKIGLQLEQSSAFL